MGTNSSPLLATLLADAQNQDKSNTQYLGDEKDVSGMKGDMVPPRANMFQRGDLNTSLGSSMKFQELGRCPPVGGAFNEVYAAGYDDLGYTVPSPIDPSSQATGHFQQALQAQGKICRHASKGKTLPLHTSLSI